MSKIFDKTTGELTNMGAGAILALIIGALGTLWTWNHFEIGVSSPSATTASAPVAIKSVGLPTQSDEDVNRLAVTDGPIEFLLTLDIDDKSRSVTSTRVLGMASAGCPEIVRSWLQVGEISQASLADIRRVKCRAGNHFSIWAGENLPNLISPIKAGIKANGKSISKNYPSNNQDIISAVISLP